MACSVPDLRVRCQCAARSDTAGIRVAAWWPRRRRPRGESRQRPGTECAGYVPSAQGASGPASGGSPSGLSWPSSPRDDGGAGLRSRKTAAALCACRGPGQAKAVGPALPALARRLGLQDRRSYDLKPWMARFCGVPYPSFAVHRIPLLRVPYPSIAVYSIPLLRCTVSLYCGVPHPSIAMHHIPLLRCTVSPYCRGTKRRARGGGKEGGARPRAECARPEGCAGARDGVLSAGRPHPLPPSSPLLNFPSFSLSRSSQAPGISVIIRIRRWPALLPLESARISSGPIGSRGAFGHRDGHRDQERRRHIRVASYKGAKGARPGLGSAGRGLVPPGGGVWRRTLSRIIDIRRDPAVKRGESHWGLPA